MPQIYLHQLKVWQQPHQLDRHIEEDFHQHRHRYLAPHLIQLSRSEYSALFADHNRVWRCSAAQFLHQSTGRQTVTPTRILPLEPFFLSAFSKLKEQFPQ